MIGTVFDTNVIVSSFLNGKGLEATGVDLALAGELQLFASEAVLAEYETTLSRPKFGISSEQVKELVDALRKVAVIVDPNQTLAVSPHEAGNQFLECVEAAQADVLITGNKRHVPAEWKGTRIVNAREFLI